MLPKHHSHVGSIRDVKVGVAAVCAQVVDKLGITDFPTLVVLPADGGETVVYKGELKPAALAAFLETHAAAEPQAGGSAAASDSDLVESVDSGNVATLVEGERPAWLLVFAGSEEADLPTEGGIGGLAEMLNGQVKVGKASADLATKFGVTLGSAPTIAMWPYRRPGKPRKASTFAGTMDGVAAAKKAALETLPDDGVTILNQATADRWMQESMMTVDSKAFCMLFSDKHAPPLGIPPGTITPILDHAWQDAAWAG